MAATSVSLMNATMRIGPPHSVHVSTSKPKTRWSNADQTSLGGRVGSGGGAGSSGIVFATRRGAVLDGGEFVDGEDERVHALVCIDHDARGLAVARHQRIDGGGDLGFTQAAHARNHRAQLGDIVVEAFDGVGGGFCHDSELSWARLTVGQP